MFLTAVPSNQKGRKGMRATPVLWMDKILHHPIHHGKSISHHFETMGNHKLLVLTGESHHSRVS